jgi:hypothetical protein
MEYEIRANIVMSRNLTVEADNLKEAMEKVKDMMAEPFPSKELKPRKVYYDIISPSAT